jgi:hypothetical protein
MASVPAPMALVPAPTALGASTGGIRATPKRIRGSAKNPCGSGWGDFFSVLEKKGLFFFGIFHFLSPTGTIQIVHA